MRRGWRSSIGRRGTRPNGTSPQLEVRSADMIKSDWTTETNARRLTLFRELLGMFPTGRMADLGTGHGKFAQIAAAVGWQVVGIDARTERWPHDPAITWIHQDIREADLTGFDLISCLGLFYHLTVDDQVDLLKRCSGKPIIIDTHLANGRSSMPLSDLVTVGGYEGCWYGEPPSLLSSWRNDRSFWPTPAAFRQMLSDAGYQIVLEASPAVLPDRSFYVALFA